MFAQHELQEYLNTPKTTKKFPTSIAKGIRNADITLWMRILETYHTCPAEIEERNIQDVFKNHEMDYRSRGAPTVCKYSKEYESPSEELAWPPIAL